MSYIDWSALRVYWREREAEIIPSIHESLARKGIWISPTLVADEPKSSLSPRAPHKRRGAR